MSLIDNYETKRCEWCGSNLIFHRKKKYCNSSCRSYAWRHKNNKIPHKKNTTLTTSPQQMKPSYIKLTYLKRRSDVGNFPGYLKLINRFNKLLSAHLKESFYERQLYALEITYLLLAHKKSNPKERKKDIAHNLNILERSIN